MAKTWNERYNETVTKSDDELERSRQDRSSRDEETGVIEFIQNERAEEKNLRGYDQGYG